MRQEARLGVLGMCDGPLVGSVPGKKYKKFRPAGSGARGQAVGLESRAAGEPRKWCHRDKGSSVLPEYRPDLSLISGRLIFADKRLESRHVAEQILIVG